MKKIIVILLLGTLALPAFSQADVPLPPGYGRQGAPSIASTNHLTRFDLDFAGGTPTELVKAIEMASEKRLNTIIPDELVAEKLPALKMKGVTVPELFDALTLASLKSVSYMAGAFLNSPRQESYGFKTIGNPREDSIWVFYHSAPEVPPSTPPQKPNLICRYYQLAPYLETYKVEDIITAVETGYKMLGDKNLPKISFHKDTKLLIAVGEKEKLELIDSVLQQLKSSPQRDSGDKELQAAGEKGQKYMELILPPNRSK